MRLTVVGVNAGAKNSVAGPSAPGGHSLPRSTHCPFAGSYLVVSSPETVSGEVEIIADMIGNTKQKLL
jgi:hypothetical protein